MKEDDLMLGTPTAYFIYLILSLANKEIVGRDEVTKVERWLMRGIKVSAGG